MLNSFVIQRKRGTLGEVRRPSVQPGSLAARSHGGLEEFEFSVL